MISRPTEARGGSAAERHPQETAGVIEDYKLEELLRCPFRPTKPRAGYPGQPRSGVTWRQLVQYSASHIVNDYYSLPPERRSSAAIEQSAHRRWSNKAYQFESAGHYHHIRNTAVANLSRFLHEGRDIVPMVLFETLRRYIPKVEADVTFNMQVLYRNGKGESDPYVVQKYLVDDDPGVLIGFRHLAVLFCSEAFGRVPDRLEIFGVLSGNRYVYRPLPVEVAKASDYISLFRDYLPEAGRGRSAADRMSACGKCALRTECDRAEQLGVLSPERRLLH